MKFHISDFKLIWVTDGWAICCEIAPRLLSLHYNDVIMTTMASQITSLAAVYSIVYSGANERKHQSSASLALVRGIHRSRWIPRAKGQLRGKCFHLMTSSWHLSDDKSMLIHIMTWCRRATSHLSQYWHRSMSSYGFIRPQWVKSLSPIYWRYMATYIWVNIGPGNGLSPDTSKPISGSILNYHQWTSVVLTQANFAGSAQNINS